MIELIPAIDLMDGKCVRLHRGDFDSAKIYSNQAPEVARQFELAGVKRLHVVDLDGARTGSPKNLNIVETICKQTGLIVDFGGGIRQTEDLRSVWSSGVSMVSIGSMALTNPDALSGWIEEFGAERFFLGADVKGEQMVYRGWQSQSSVSWQEFIGKWLGMGISSFFSTNVERDGAMTGPDLDLYARILKQYPEINLVASGGISGWSDLHELDILKLSGAIIGKAFYEGLITLDEISKWNQNAG